MKKIKQIATSLAIGITLELLILAAGNFDLRIGGYGPACPLLFMIHLPAWILCGILPIRIQSEVTVMILMAIIFSTITFMITSLLNRNRKSRQTARALNTSVTTK